VSFCQRFGSSLNLNIHWHVVVPDALFLPDATGEHVDTLKHRVPTRLDLEEIVTSVATRCVRWLGKHGYLRSEGEDDPAENADTDSPWMRCLQGCAEWILRCLIEPLPYPDRFEIPVCPTRLTCMRDLLCLIPSWPKHRILELASGHWKKTLEEPETQQSLTPTFSVASS
jgi:hypothetical protein